MTSPTQRSLKHMRDAGWRCEVVEKFNHFTKTRKDLFGFADILCVKPGHTPILLQVTSTGWSSRVKKILEDPLAQHLLASGFEIHVHGWRKLKSNKNRVTICETHITASMFEAR